MLYTYLYVNTFLRDGLPDIWIWFAISLTLIFRNGKIVIDHPDDKDRFSTRFQRRHDAVQNRLRGKENKKEARMAGYAVS